MAHTTQSAGRAIEPGPAIGPEPATGDDDPAIDGGVIVAPALWRHRTFAPFGSVSIGGTERLSSKTIQGGGQWERSRCMSS